MPLCDGRESLNHIMQAGVLNQLLRQQLKPVPAKADESPTITNEPHWVNSDPLSSAVAAVDYMLHSSSEERDILHQLLSALYHQLKQIYQSCDIEPELRKRQFISHCGLIISSDDCIETILDDLRVRAFTRGIDQAIRQMERQRNGLKRVHIVYPACGPFAPLLLPLIAYYHANKIYTAQQLRITLIDIQPAAAKTLQLLVTELGIKDYIRQICCMDALQYDPAERAVDMVVLEAMQHGLSREGFFVIARHFSQMLEDDGVLIPQKVRVSAVLNEAQREFVDQWQDAQAVSADNLMTQVQQERTILGEILHIDKDVLTELKERVLDEHTTLVECAKVQIPDLSDKTTEQTLLICTEINTFADEVIGEYDSGITHPLPDTQVCIDFKPKQEQPGDLLLNSGDAIKFYYRLNGLPGFLACWAPGAQDGL